MFRVLINLMIMSENANSFLEISVTVRMDDISIKSLKMI